MIPIKLTLRNFLSFKEPIPLIFSNIHLAVLSGNNGVGKSSVLEAITWALWGETRANSDDEIINQGTTSCWVEFIFEHERNLYRVLRKREKKHKNGVSLLEFQTQKKSKDLIGDETWESIAEGTLKATQDKIVNILKIPYDIFVNSSYLRQGHADEFTTKTPAERKEILSEVLGLNYYEVLAQKSREQMRSATERIRILEIQIEDIQIEIAEKKSLLTQKETASEQKKSLEGNLDATKKLLDSLEKDKTSYGIAKEKIAFLSERYSEIEEKTQEFKNEFDSNKSEESSLKNKIAKKDLIEKQYAEFVKLEKESSRLNLLFRNHSEIQQELSVLAHIKNDLDKNIQRINNIARCPVCLRDMDKKESANIIKHLRDEFKNKYAKKYQDLQLRLQKLNYSEEKHKKIDERLKGLQQSREEKNQLDLAENNLNNIISSNNKILLQFGKLKKEASLISKEGKLLKEKILKLEKSNQKWVEKKQEEENLRQSLTSTLNIIAALDQQLIQIEKREKSLKETESEVTKTKKEVSNYEELSQAFGKNGIQAMIIEQSLVSIEENANILLKKITDGRMSLAFITQKEKKSGKENDNLIETLEIKISDELGERDYEMYSGGEAFRINFAIRIALSKLLASRAGTHLKFLAIDEGFGMLDSAGRDDLVSAINSISPDFEKILVITHLQELKDLFPSRIDITKDSQGSHFQIASV